MKFLLFPIRPERAGVFFRVSCFAIFAALVISNNSSAESENLNSISDQIKKNFQMSLPAAQITAITETPMVGIFQVELASGELVYSNEIGSFLIAGELFQLKPGARPLNITEEWRGNKRVEMLADLESKDMVVFSPAGEVKGIAYVFTDVDCGYCQKFHAEVPKLNELGVEVRYLAWPRAGVDSPTGEKMRAVWCAVDRKSAMTKAKQRLAVETPAGDCVSPMKDQLVLGHKMGVRGTPAVYLSDGTHAGGYVKAEDLASRLGIAPTVSAPLTPKVVQ